MNPGVQLQPAPNTEQFEAIRHLLHAHFGITLSDAKRPMVVRQLQSLLADHALGSYAELCALLEQDHSGKALSSLANRLSTNHSFFFREPRHFEFFSSVALPEAMKARGSGGRNDLRVWSAGCSTGEEPYLLAMLMFEQLGEDYSRWDAGVLATDISGEALAAGRAGSYAYGNVRRLPRNLRDNYLRELRHAQWRVIEPLRREVTFRKFNLITPHWTFRRPFDLIFCRNVMLYFDPAVKRRVVESLYRNTEPGGYLFVGLSETLRDIESGFAYVEPGVYRRPPGS